MNMHTRTRLKYKLAFIVFVWGIILSAIFGYQIHQNNQSRVNQAASESLDNTVKTIFSSIELYQYGLRCGRGAMLTVGENNISQKLFYRYSG
jgi:CHASE1-domain containing sensor protein